MSKKIELVGSPEARKKTFIMIEVFGGMLSPSQACQQMNVCNSRFYQLELKVLNAIIKALEPVSKGYVRTPEMEIKNLIEEKTKLEHELLRYQTLVRAAQRSLGIKTDKKSKNEITPKTVLKKRKRYAEKLEVNKPDN